MVVKFGASSLRQYASRPSLIFDSTLYIEEDNLKALA